MTSSSEHPAPLLGGNRDPPVSRIPEDALVEIFDYHTPRNNLPLSHPFDTWLNIIHVCRRWRAVAIEHASWWTNIITSDPDLTSFMLTNSRNAPLVFDLDVTSGKRSMSYALRLVKTNLPRIRSLRISFIHIRAPSRILQVLQNQKCPMLVDIEFRQTDEDYLFNTFVPADAFPQTPVTTLLLDNCYFSTGSTCHNLTSLTVKAFVHETIWTVSNTPNLVNLCVITRHDQSLHRLPSHPESSDDTVGLPDIVSTLR